MKIFCYLWLAFLVVCFIFEKVAAWLSNNKRFYKDEVYSYPKNDYESFEFNDDDDNENNHNNNVRKRNERESDFYDIEENIYDSSNDMNPSLNLFSWWSSKNKGINRNNNNNNKKNNISNYNNFDINDNKLKKEFIKNILENSILDYNLSNEIPALKMTSNPIGLSNFLYTPYKSRLNLQLNFIESTTKQQHFLHKPSATTPIINYMRNPITNDFDKIFGMNEMNSPINETTENITETVRSYYNENITEKQIENGTNSNESLFQNVLKTSTPHNDNADDIKKKISATRSYSICTSPVYTKETGSIVYSSLKPTFRTCMPKKERLHGLPSFSRKKQTNNDLNVTITNKYRSSNNSDQITGHISSSCSTATSNIYTEQMSATKVLSTKYYTPGHVPPPTSGIIKQALMNISRQFNLHKGLTLPFPQTVDGGILKNTTATPPFTLNTETIFTPIEILTTPLTADLTTFVAENRKNTTKEDDPFSFLKPIPTLKTDIVQKTMKGIPETEGQHMNISNGNKNEEMNSPKSQSYIYLKNKNKPNSDDSNRTEPKFVLPEYLSGLYRPDDNTNRKKRTPKNIITNVSNNDLIKIMKNNFPTNNVDIRKLIGRQCQNSGETSEYFLSKFKNLQNDLNDLQKALVAQAKDLSTADDYTPMINDRNMSVHVRVIVDVLNGTDGNHLTSASESSLGANRSIEDLEDLNHTLTKRSWFFVPPSDLQNQPQQYLIEKIIQQKVLDELKKSMLKKTNDGNFLKENNDDLKVNLNFPSLLLKDDIIATTIRNPIITTDISSYDSQNNLSKQKGSKFLLTKTQLVDPIAKNNIVNPVNKAIYSKYLTGKKYLVIPLSYLEEQNKKSNNNSYNILQPTSVFFKILGNNAETDKNEPKNFIAKYLNKIRSNKNIKATNKDKQKLYLNNLENKFKDSNNREVNLLTGRNGTTNMNFGEPGIICSRNNKHKIVIPYKDDNLNNLVSNRKSDHSVTLLLDHNELLKDLSNPESLNLNDVDNDHTRPIIRYIKYPVYNLNSYQLRNDNNENELLKARRESNCRTTKPFLFFTLPNKELDVFQTEKPPCTSYCKLNLAPLVKYKDSNYNYTNNKSSKTKTPNLKTFKVDLNIDEDPFDRLDWSLVKNKNALNDPRQFDLTSSDTQGALLFASKINKKKRGIQNLKRFKRIPRENNLRRNEENLMRIKHKMNGVDKVRESSRQPVPLAIKKVNTLNRKLDKSKYKSYDKKLTWGDYKYGSKLTNNMDKDKIQIRMRTSNLINDLENDDADSGIAEMMNTNQSRYYSLHGTRAKITTTENIVKAKLKDFGHKLQDSLHSTVKTGTTSKSTAKPKATTSKHSDVKNETCTTKNGEICPESEDVCTGVPPSTFKPAPTGTDLLQKNATTATPSEQEIEDACTECVCGNHDTQKSACTVKNGRTPGGNHKKVHEHSSVRPRGVQCHHHLKNHTTIEHHKMHEHNKSDSGKNGKKKECIKKT